MHRGHGPSIKRHAGVPRPQSHSKNKQQIGAVSYRKRCIETQTAVILHITSSMHHQDDHYRSRDGGARYRIHAEVQRRRQHHLDLRAFLQSLSRCTALTAFISWSVRCGQLCLPHRRSIKARAGLRPTLGSPVLPGNPPHPQPIHFSERGPYRPSQLN